MYARYRVSRSVILHSLHKGGENSVDDVSDDEEEDNAHHNTVY
jgi:hypothetical protein